MNFIIHCENEHTGKRLDVVISDSGHGLSRSQAKNLIEQGNVLVDGNPVNKAGTVVRAGQSVAVTVPPPRKLDLTPAVVGIRILHEDSHLAVLEKPAGISVHPSETEDEPTVVHGLLHELQSLSTVGGVERPGIVHRIDKGTSGILVVSKSDEAHVGLSEQFKEHTIDRKYKALVYGNMKEKLRTNSGTIETLIGRSPTNRKKMSGKVTRGRKAVTHWRILEEPGPFTLVECTLETGRTHQIRVHLSEQGFPLVGDTTYGDHSGRARALRKKHPELAEACVNADHQMLHAYFLAFKHPVTGERISFQSELPADFAHILELARQV